MMDEVNITVLNVFEHFISNLNNSINGLYKIKFNNESAIIFRNGDSWGVLSHYLGEPVTKCIGFMRSNRVEAVEKAINDYLKQDDDYDYDFKRCMR